jgi:hypothetical protein
VQFLVQKFNFFGIEGQYWMLVVIGLLAVFGVSVWRARDKI